MTRLRADPRLELAPAFGLTLALALGLVLSGCASHPRRPKPAPPPLPPPAAPTALPATPASLAAAVAADSARLEHETSAGSREAVANDATRNAEACLAQAPQAVECLYSQGVALGLNAGVHPTKAGQLLNQMLDALKRAEAVDPSYDQAGPARVRALVLTRAPGWPLGPGDPAAGLTAARQAVELKPTFPPNLLALAEAQAKTGDAQGARTSYARAREAALAWPASEGDRAAWVREANKGLGQP